MSELVAPPGCSASQASLIAAALARLHTGMDADINEPVLSCNGDIFKGTTAVLRRIATGSSLLPEAAAAAVDHWLGVAAATDAASSAWVEPTASQASVEDRAASKAKLIQLLTAVETQLAGGASSIAGSGVTIADIALATVLQPLFSLVLGAQARTPFPASISWLQSISQQPEFAKAMGTVVLCPALGDWLAPAARETAKKDKKAAYKAGAKEGAPKPKPAPKVDTAEGNGEAVDDDDDMDPEKAAKKTARLADKAAKAKKFAEKQAAADKAALAKQAKAATGGDDKKNNAKADAEAKKRAEAEESVRLLAEVRATPVGAKKNIKGAVAKTYNPRIVETAWYEWWEACGYFKPDVTSDKPPFVIVIPPPNVTGALHIGHALTNSIQDAVVRWRRMSGYNTVWVPGTDHAGIATQTVVEKKIQREQGKTRHDLGREAFLGEVWGWVGEYGDRICNQLRRLGSSVDWSRQVFTMDNNMSRAVNEAFVRMHQSGVIYRDNRLVNWCCKLKTAVSDIEVDYIDVPRRSLLSVPGYSEPVEFGVLTSFAYQLEGGEGEIVVATTRPETMLGDTAVAVHPDDPRYTHMHGKFVIHPINGRRIPIIQDAEIVDMAFGTGAVKITPAHDPNDFKSGKRHNLEFINILDDDGCINEKGEPFTGQPRFKARVTVVDMLKEKGLFRGTADNEMRLGLCSRSKDVIEPVLKPQWWVKCDDMAARACEAVRSGELEIIPKEFEAVWFRWLENIRDWCISRQLWWGHRIPAYYVHLQGEASMPGAPSEDSNRWVVGRNKIDAEAVAAERFPGQTFTLAQDEDVLDTWFSSGLFPFSVFNWPEASPDLERFYPGALLETGHDILFFWVARMVMQGLQLTGKVPFKQVYLHAMVRDAHGRKMSKSLGNVIDPLNVIEGITLEGLHATLVGGNLEGKEAEKARAGQKADYPDGIEECGTDALRFALCAYTSQARDINLDIKRVVAYRHWCNKLYNAIRFASMNLPEDYVPPQQPLQLDPATLPHASQWLLSKLSAASAAVVKAMGAYEFAVATQKVYSFWQYELCDVYIELMKPVMALDDSDPVQAATKRGTRDALWIALDAGLRLLHPFMPFITEELWQRLPRHPDAQMVPSIMLADYPQAVPAWENSQLETDYEYLQSIITKIRKLRTDYGLQKQRPQLYLVVSSPDKAAVLQRSAAEIAALTVSSEVVVVVVGTAGQAQAGPPSGCGVAIVDEATVAHLLLVGVLDPALEVAKLEKKTAEIAGRLEAMAKRVAFAGYADKTPEAVKEEDEDKRVKMEAERAAAQSALADMQLLLKGS